MLKKFSREIINNRLCKKEDRILLAVSGGADSMVMAYMFHATKFQIGVAHCNFQLRGEEAFADEDFVQKWCSQFSIPYHSKRFDTNNYAAENGLSIQMAARELRYSWFNELLENENYDYLATAHHLNDNIETTLLNLVRGTGLNGLRGIPFKVNKIVRPLLSFTKDELTAFAELNGITWREDVSNETDDYDRNYLRHQIIPKLKTLNPSLESSFKKTNKRLHGAEALFQLGLEGLKQEFILIESGITKIDKAFLLVTQFPAEVAWELIKEYGFNYSQCVDAAQVSTGISGKKFLSMDYQLTIDRDTWIISRHTDRLTERIILEGELEVTYGKQDLLIEKVPLKSISSDPLVAMLDADRVKYPLTWRKWENGDVFSPLGMSGKKKLSDFFIDIKLSIVDKEEATVIESNGEIVWVVGQRIDNAYKVTNQTREILRLVVEKHHL